MFASLDNLLEVLQLLLLVKVRKLIEHFVALLWKEISVVMESLTSDSSSQFKVLLLHSDSAGMDGAQVGIFEEADKVHLSSFLDSQESLGLESDLDVNTLCDGSHKTLEGCSQEEEVGALLVSLDLSDSDGAWPEADLPLLLDASLSWSSFLLGSGFACL